MHIFCARAGDVHSIVVNGGIVGYDHHAFGECRAVARDICSLWPNEADEVMHRARFFVRDLEKRGATTPQILVRLELDSCLEIGWNC